jgi:hypothetical protein
MQAWAACGLPATERNYFRISGSRLAACISEVCRGNAMLRVPTLIWPAGQRWTHYGRLSGNWHPERELQRGVGDLITPSSEVESSQNGDK